MDLLYSIPFLFFLSLFAYLIVAVTVLLKKKSKISLKMELLKVIFFVYILVLLYITILPLTYTGQSLMNGVPFKTISLYFSNRMPFEVALKNVLGNIVLFVPIGVWVPLLFHKGSFKTVIFIGAISSIGIEGIQFLLSLLKISSRAVDIDDVILNSLGAMLGYSLYWGCYKLLKPARHDRNQAKFLRRDRV